MGKAYSDKNHLAGGEMIRQVALGMNDGVVSIFALLAGIAGAGQDASTILVTLIAATIAGAISMAAGEFISEKNENDFYKNEINRERLEMILVPDVEKMEIREIYRKKGFQGSVLEEIVDQITKDPERWLRELVIEEIGIADIETEGMWKNILTIFIAFSLGASFSVIPYMIFQSLPGDTIFLIATIVTFGGLFIVGALKKFVTGQYWLKSGLEMLAVGAFTFLISYFIGEAVGVAV